MNQSLSSQTPGLAPAHVPGLKEDTQNILQKKDLGHHLGIIIHQEEVQHIVFNHQKS